VQIDQNIELWTFDSLERRFGNIVKRIVILFQVTDILIEFDRFGVSTFKCIKCNG
jgi:hypothetical protein